jgi:hypothetical protein
MVTKAIVYQRELTPSKAVAAIRRFGLATALVLLNA